jgi:hypothetical protein
MRRVLPTALCLSLAASAAWAASPSAPASRPANGSASTQPATSPAHPSTQPAGGAQARVVSVTGQAQKSIVDEGGTIRWQPVRQGDELSEKTIIRTGLDSGVLLDLAGRGQVRVGSATKMGIGELKIDGALAKTRLGLKYGTIRADVDSHKGPADFRVATPTATLSVRGSALEASVTNENGTRGYSLAGILSLTKPGLAGQAGQPGEFVFDSGQMSVPYLFFLHTAIPGDPGGMNPWELVTWLENNRGRELGPESVAGGGANLNSPVHPSGGRDPGFP